MLSGGWQFPADFQLCRKLKPLLDFKKVEQKNISYPYLFMGAPMVIIFVRSAWGRMKGVWHLIEKVSQPDIRLAEMEHPSLKKALSYCSGQIPELGTGSLRQTVGVLIHEDIRAIVDSEFDGSKPCPVESQGTEGSKKVCALAWWTLEPQAECCCSAKDSLQLHCRLSDAGGWLCRPFSTRKL